MIMIMHILVVTNCVGDIAELCRVILPRHWINGTQYATICHIYPTTTPIIHNPHMPHCHMNIGLGLVLESFAWNVLFFWPNLLLSWLLSLESFVGDWVRNQLLPAFVFVFALHLYLYLYLYLYWYLYLIIKQLGFQCTASFSLHLYSYLHLIFTYICICICIYICIWSLSSWLLSAQPAFPCICIQTLCAACWNIKRERVWISTDHIFHSACICILIGICICWNIKRERES